MSEKELKELFVKSLEEFNAIGGDVSRVSAWIDKWAAPGIVFHSTGGALNFEQTKQMYTEEVTAFGLVINVKHTVVEGDMEVFNGSWSGTHQGTFKGTPATGKQVEVDMAFMAKIRDGKWIEAWTYQDNLSLMRQLGAAPSPVK